MSNGLKTHHALAALRNTSILLSLRVWYASEADPEAAFKDTTNNSVLNVAPAIVRYIGPGNWPAPAITELPLLYYASGGNYGEKGKQRRVE